MSVTKPGVTDNAANLNSASGSQTAGAANPPGVTPMDMTCINTIRTLSMDAVQAANSGHPGTPMAMAPLVYCLWQEFLRYDPSDPVWPNRDRFILSAGHASMLLYSMLHLTGVKESTANFEVLDKPSVPLNEIKRFRQLGSKCPGHPESHVTTGVETTTGPLGQGYANSVGIALAGRWLASRYNQAGMDAVYDFNVYALGGDGCMMEGISSEAASLAGHRLWLERHARHRRQRPGNDSRRLSRVLANERPAHADHRQQPHRLGLSA